MWGYIITIHPLSHSSSSVASPDVIFGDQVPSGVGDKTIDIAALKKLGDTETKKLAAALGV